MLSLVYRQYSWPFIAITLLSLLSAVSGIGVIAFINPSLVESVGDPLPVLGQLLGLILLLLVITLGSQLALTTLGHHFVYRLRGRLLKQLLDTDVARIRQLGQGPLLASLSSDIGQITIAFVRLPELVQGLVLTVGSALYLGWLSPALLGVTALWVTVTMVVGWLLALHPWRTPVAEPMPLLRRAWQGSAVLLVALLVCVVYRDLPGATERSQHYIDVTKRHLQPRFWVQGVIAPHIR